MMQYENIVVLETYYGILLWLEKTSSRQIIPNSSSYHSTPYSADIVSIVKQSIEEENIRESRKTHIGEPRVERAPILNVIKL
jgi:hypothetical protein